VFKAILMARTAEMLYGKDVAINLCNIIEYDRHEDPSWDPFAKIHNVPGSS
jgi:hypothetical protein